ncbi:membrane-associated protein [Jatrophihabitans sp. GAS493]|uniref:DedA family protein n=1 Tax=Jatrophihabitans sp. GAS493 TaxID=1907575 RepID=UPI000BB80740|nr:DedA family protein [Jatrophihabitans sp. GAS493]SOD72797.1 membrane-associated protein [Jatrophihabitans sp. GAS493]
MNILNPTHLISSYGTLGLAFIIFAETGLLIGFFLPGDSLLFLAGAYSAASVTAPIHLNLGLTLVAVIVAAIAGGEVGYFIGRRLGPELFKRRDSRFFKQQNVTRSREFLDEYGPGKALLIARFVPIVRTLMNPVAGVLRVPLRSFTVFNVVGGVLWAGGVTLLGYFLGSAINIDKYILPVTAGVILISLIPLGLEYRRQRSRADGPA